MFTKLGIAFWILNQLFFTKFDINIVPFEATHISYFLIS
jgi:hypothetical protein